MKALRVWAAQVGRTVNTGSYDDAALDALMTLDVKHSMKIIAGGEVGHRYAGPVPFTPVKVTPTSSKQHDVHICVVVGGYSLNPKTGRPFSKYKVLAIDSGAIKQGMTWRVSQFAITKFSCAGVKIPEPSYP